MDQKVSRACAVHGWSLGQWCGWVVTRAAIAIAVMPISAALAESAGGNVDTTQPMAALDMGGEHGCVVDVGQVFCWGSNELGQLGNGSSESFSLIRTPVSGITNAIEVSIGGDHSCALLADGFVQCWGLNEVGQLGDETQNNSATPVTVSGITTAVSVTAGGSHSCALLSDSSVQCWGENDSGQLGDGTKIQSSRPVGVIGVLAESVSAGLDQTCALTGGDITCWGFASSEFPQIVSGISSATAVSAALDYTCALLDGGAVRCWGVNRAGQLGIGSNQNLPSPTIDVVGVSNGVAVSAGAEHACALLGDGALRCWGNNEFGQLGNGATQGSTTSVEVSNIVNATAVSAGASHTCASLDDGAIWCWGANDFGQLGDGRTEDSSVPVETVETAVPGTSVCEQGDDAFEPNNSFDMASEISPGASIVARSCAGSNEDDWFRFPVVAGDTIDVELLFVHAIGDLDIELYDENEAFVEGSESGDNNESIADIVASSSGTWALNVYPFGDPFDNSYQLTVTITPAPQLCNGLPVTVEIRAGQLPTSGDDVILGTSGADVINALGGNDTVCGLGGNDIINGGDGDDVILGGEGNDVLGGQGGIDRLEGEAGADRLNGGSGNDELFGGEGEDDLRGQGDDDTLDGGAGVDQFFGGPGDDIIITGSGGNLGTGKVVRGQGNDDTITGSSEADDLNGGPGMDEISGGEGDDLLRGGNAADTLRGQAGADTLEGGASNDDLFGGAGPDTLRGGTGDDELFGEGGDDNLDGQGGTDDCDGGSADETLGDSALSCEITTGIELP